MNANKIKTLSRDLIAEIRKNEGREEWEKAKLYINTWVITCALEQINKKASGEDVRNGQGSKESYKKLFNDFITYFLCCNIIPYLKPYAFICLFNIKNRDLIIKLFNEIYTPKERANIGTVNGLNYNQVKDNITRFDMIKRYLTKKETY